MQNDANTSGLIFVIWGLVFHAIINASKFLETVTDAKKANLAERVGYLFRIKSYLNHFLKVQAPFYDTTSLGKFDCLVYQR